ncbi:MAG: hypothetical protein ACREH8_04100, partial [Opitutaceae bacterium]
VRAAEVGPSATPATQPNGGSIETTTGHAGTVPSGPAVSPVTAAKLAAAAPKFIPPADDPAPPVEPASPVTRVADKPRNQIIRLPDFIVGEPKVHVPGPLQVLTPKGRVDLGFQRRPGLRMVPLAWMNAGIAIEMLEDDLEAQRRRETAELLSLYLIR